MKKYRSIVLTLACAALVITLIVVKSGDNTQHDNDAGAITDYSNRLDSAQTEIAFGHGRILTLSNSLDESWSAAVTFSNHLVEAQSTLARDAGQITSLNQRIARAESDNQTLTQRFADLTGQLTNQMASLTQQLTAAKAGLDQANANYVLLENRLRRDVAERLVMQRKFYNLSELKAQMETLKDDPFAPHVSEQSIYAGLDVEVRSNSVYVISPN
jgi:septal ring factor EnvC (AmiA/AmiB activator)